MKIFAISGSAQTKSSNLLLLKAIKILMEDQHEVKICSTLNTFPLFSPEKLNADIPSQILNFKAQVLAADMIFISTPEYTHNIPAVLKNMIEWCTASGEFYT